MSYFLAPSLVQLRDELTRRWPSRALPDGWIGDASHSARVSDHNPDWDDPTDPGVIRAIDILRDGINVAALLDELIGDPRVWYVIHDGHIWSRTYGWAKRVYTGINKHEHHVHVSILHTHAAATDVRPWFTVAAVRAKRKLPHQVSWGPNLLFLIDTGRKGDRADAVNAFLGLGGDRFSDKSKTAAARAQARWRTYRRDGRVGYGTYRLMAKESKRKAAA